MITVTTTSLTVKGLILHIVDNMCDTLNINRSHILRFCIKYGLKNESKEWFDNLQYFNCKSRQISLVLSKEDFELINNKAQEKNISVSYLVSVYLCHFLIKLEPFVFYYKKAILGWNLKKTKLLLDYNYVTDYLPMFCDFLKKNDPDWTSVEFFSKDIKAIKELDFYNKQEFMVVSIKMMKEFTRYVFEDMITKPRKYF